MDAWDRHLPAGTTMADVDLLAGGNLPRAWGHRWHDAPDQRTVSDDEHGWVTAAELQDRTRRVAGRLAGAGLIAGDRVVLSGDASVPLVVAHVACLRLGLVVVPVDVTFGRREVEHVMSEAEPVAAIVDGARSGRWSEAAAASSSVRPLLVLDTAVDLPDSLDPAGLDCSPADAPALMAFTSGTTGSPKAAVLSHGNLLASAEAVILAWRWTAEDRLICPLPLFHLHGLGVALHGTLCAGASIVLRPGFSPGDVADAVVAHRGSLFFGVPTMWSRLLRSDRIGELAGLRLGVSGSAPLPAELHRAIAAGCGQQVIERYGMTETVMNVSNPYDGERRPGTVGVALPGVEVRLAPGTDDIWLRGPNVFSGYWGRPDATAAAFDQGWFATGDVGHIDADGYLSIVGRRKELIITGGANVYPREVEDVLRTHPAVPDVAVVGVAHPDWGEEVVAVVEGPGDDAVGVTVLDGISDSLAPYKRPKRVVFVDALPRNAMGKVVKSAVRDQLG